MGGGGANLLDSPKTGNNSDFKGDKEDPKNDEINEEYVVTYKTYNDYFTDLNIKKDTISSADYVGDGSLNNPYIVRSTRGFLWVTNGVSGLSLLNRYIVLDCDIILNDETFDNEGNISGGDGVVYQWKALYCPGMTLYGNNYKIKGLYVNKVGDFGGLFDSNAINKVQDLSFENIYSYVTNYAYAIAYRCYEIYNCNVLGGYFYATGFSASSLAHSVDKISCCKNYASVTSGSTFASGIVYFAKYSANSCENYGTVTCRGDYTGGIVSNNGCNGLIVESCKNFGNIFGKRYTGGIVSSLYGANNNIIIKNCKNFGSVSCENIVGGIMGYCCGNGIISNCENFGIANKSGFSQGAIIGYVYDPSGSTLVSVYLNECKNYSQESNSSLIGIVHQKTNIFIKNCYVEVDNYSAGYGLLIHQIEGITQINISNVKIKLTNNTQSVNYLFAYVTNKIGNVVLENVLVENDNDAYFDFIRAGNHNKALLFCDKIIVKNISNACFYYGDDFSGFYVDWKTGKIGLKAFSGKGFYQGEVSEELLKSRGYIKR